MYISVTALCLYLEINDAKEGHSNERISPRPEIHEHQIQCVAKKNDIYKQSSDRKHHHTKKKEKNKICGSPSKYDNGH